MIRHFISGVSKKILFRVCLDDEPSIKQKESRTLILASRANNFVKSFLVSVAAIYLSEKHNRDGTLPIALAIYLFYQLPWRSILNHGRQHFCIQTIR